MDNSYDELKWQPKMNAKEAVSMTMNWYKEFYTNQYKISEYTNKQILRFFKD